MSVDFEQLRDRASHWLEPIPGASPGGAPAKLEPTYQRIASEVAKLDLPAGGAIDWRKVAEGSEDLLCKRTKDLVLASYLAHALHVTRGIDGLTTGVTFLAEMLDRFWDTLHPEAKRLRGRANALQWFLEKTALTLPDGVPASTEAPKLEALETAARRLAKIVRERFADAAPAVSPLLVRIERIRVSMAEASATETAPAPVPVPAPNSPAAPAPAAELMPPAIALGELTAVGDTTEFLRRVGDALIGDVQVLPAQSGRGRHHRAVLLGRDQGRARRLGEAIRQRDDQARDRGRSAARGGDLCLQDDHLDVYEGRHHARGQLGKEQVKESGAVHGGAAYLFRDGDG